MSILDHDALDKKLSFTVGEARAGGQEIVELLDGNTLLGAAYDCLSDREKAEIVRMLEGILLRRIRSSIDCWQNLA